MAVVIRPLNTCTLSTYIPLICHLAIARDVIQYFTQSPLDTKPQVARPVPWTKMRLREHLQKLTCKTFKTYFIKSSSFKTLGPYLLSRYENANISINHRVTWLHSNVFFLFFPTGVEWEEMYVFFFWTSFNLYSIRHILI
jgi:hypothetical protein